MANGDKENMKVRNEENIEMGSSTLILGRKMEPYSSKQTRNLENVNSTNLIQNWIDNKRWAPR